MNYRDHHIKRGAGGWTVTNASDEVLSVKHPNIDAAKAWVDRTLGQADPPEGSSAPPPAVAPAAGDPDSPPPNAPRELS